MVSSGDDIMNCSHLKLFPRFNVQCIADPGHGGHQRRVGVRQRVHPGPALLRHAEDQHQAQEHGQHPLLLHRDVKHLKVFFLNLIYLHIMLLILASMYNKFFSL